MAHSALIVEQYVYHFLSQWHAGLQPSLRLDVQLNGSIAVSLNLTTPKNAISRDYHRSGQGAPRRRRVRRCTADPQVVTSQENMQENVSVSPTHNAATEVSSFESSTEFVAPKDDLYKIMILTMMKSMLQRNIVLSFAFVRKTVARITFRLTTIDILQYSIVVSWLWKRNSRVLLFLTICVPIAINLTEMCLYHFVVNVLRMFIKMDGLSLDMGPGTLILQMEELYASI